MLCEKEGPSGVMVFGHKSLVGFPGGWSGCVCGLRSRAYLRKDILTHRAIKSGRGSYGREWVPCPWGSAGRVGVLRGPGALDWGW